MIMWVQNFSSNLPQEGPWFSNGICTQVLDC